VALRPRDAAGLAPRPGALFARRASPCEALEEARPRASYAPGFPRATPPGDPGFPRATPPGDVLAVRVAGGPDDAPRPCARPECDDGRFRRLYEDSHDFIGRLLRRLGVPHDAIEDAVQEVFFVTSRRLEDIAEGRERAFVFGVAMRVASGHRRAAMRKRRTQPEDALDARPSHGPTPEALADEKRAYELLGRALERMALDLRSVVVLFELEELTAVEISRRLAIPQGTVMSRLRRARQQLREFAVEGGMASCASV
jgi:RNA polymerase sigma-70 factor, ECF subfamily